MQTKAYGPGCTWNLGLKLTSYQEGPNHLKLTSNTPLMKALPPGPIMEHHVEDVANSRQGSGFGGYRSEEIIRGPPHSRLVLMQHWHYSDHLHHWIHATN